MQTKTFFHIRTHLQAGNANSDTCYYTRNLNSIKCGLLSWPQDSNVYPECNKYNNEHNLRACLSISGEPDWWKPFPGCTDAQQCIATTPAYVEPHT